MKIPDLQAALKSNQPRDSLFLPDIENQIAKLKEDEIFTDYLTQIKFSAEKFTNISLPDLTLNDFKLFKINGSRKKYEKKYFQRREALVSLGVMFILTNEQKSYLDSLEEVIWQICNEFTWALPAHIQWEELNEDEKLNLYSLYNQQENNNFINKSKKLIDLFAAETAFSLAEIAYLLEKDLSPLILNRIKNEISSRVLLPFSNLKNKYWWENAKMNWAAVCAASVGSAAIYLLNDTKELVFILKRVIKSLTVYLSSFAEDGISREGLAYWNYGFSFYTYFSDLLKKRSANRINLMNYPEIENIAYFQQKMFLSDDQIISFSDTPLTFKFRAGFTSKLKEFYPDLDLPELKYKADFHSDDCYRWPHIIRDLFWTRTELFNRQKFKFNNLDYQEEYSYAEAAKWLFYKNKFNNHKLVIAAKAGNNNEPHNHNDLGSFIYHFAGESFLVDPGSGEYNKDYFGENRYDYIVTSSFGHSTAIIGGKGQLAGKSFCTSGEKISTISEQIIFKFNLEKAYQLDSLRLYQRKFLINRMNGHLKISDKFDFTEKSNLMERFVSFFKPEKVADNLVKIQGKKNSILIKYDPILFDFELDSVNFTTHTGKTRTLQLIDFRINAAISSTEFVFEIFPFLEN